VRNKIFYKLVSGATLCMALLAHSPASSAPLVLPNKTVMVTASGTQTDEVLRDLFQQAGLKVKVSSLVSAPMNGKWTVPANVLWRMLSETHNLVAFYDTEMVRIYAASELKSVIIPTPVPADVVREAERRGLLDAHNTVRAGKSNIAVVGVPEFIRRIEDIAAGKASKHYPTAPQNSLPIWPRESFLFDKTDILSPFGEKTKPRFSIQSHASEKSPYEVRIFYLYHRSASDEENFLGGERHFYPGMATVLKSVMDQQVGAQDSSLSGPRIAADALNNSILVRDRPEAMALYESIISSADIEQPQVEIEATIVELNISKLKQLGVDTNPKTNWIKKLFGVFEQAGSEGANPKYGSSGLKGNSSDVNLRLAALVQNSAARIVSKPRVTTRNNRFGIFSDETTISSPAADKTIKLVYKDRPRLVFKFKPTVKYELNKLSTDLDIFIQDGTTLRIDDSGSVQRKTATVSSKSELSEGEALIIGGLTLSSEYEDRSKTAGLSDIPGFEKLLKKKRTGGQRFERLFIITPRIYAAATSPAGRATSNKEASAAKAIPLKALERNAPIPGGRR
jgi:type III secretion protein C